MLINRFLIFILYFLFVFSKRLDRYKKIIYVVYAINNKYTDYFCSSIISLLENSERNTFYHIIIQLGSSFEQNNKDIILNLEKYYFNVFIQFIDMSNEFLYAVKGKLDQSTYYRLHLPILVQNINRIIHIDSDTVILKDLTELYTLNFERKYILGRLDMITDELDKLGIFTKIYINCGVILMDLYSLRKNNYTSKFNNYVKNHNNYNFLNHHDQTCINFVCYDRIGLFRPKYHMWPFLTEKEVMEFNKKLRYPYNEKVFLEDYYDPFIVHFPGEYKNEKKYLSNKYFKIFVEFRGKADNLKNYNNTANFINITNAMNIKNVTKIS